jgi:peptide deformylase
MALLNIVYAPHPIFKERSQPVASVDEATRALVQDMFETLYHEEALGLSAPMVGIARRVAVIDVQEEGEKRPIALINPEITWRSDAMQSFSEASLSFPYISAEITRPAAIDVKFLDAQGQPQTLRAEGFLATVIQHEMDYFEGRTFLDHLSRMKRDILVKKMLKQLKLNPPHVHGEHCHH